jgi:hypothetical protein
MPMNIQNFASEDEQKKFDKVDGLRLLLEGVGREMTEPQFAGLLQRDMQYLDMLQDALNKIVLTLDSVISGFGA